MLNRDKLREIHADIQSALEAVAKKHGLVASQQSRLTYGTSSFKFTTEFAEASAAGDATFADPKLVRNAERFGTFIGLGTSALGKSFQDTRLGLATQATLTAATRRSFKLLTVGCIVFRRTPSLNS